MPFTRAQLERSDLARRFGLDNTIPAHLLSRARGLARVAGDLGVPVSSAYRSPLLNALLDAVERNPDVSIDPALVTPSPATRPHVSCTSLDLDDPDGPTAALAALERTPHAAHVAQVLNEGDHLHVQFVAAYLESLDDGVRE